MKSTFVALSLIVLVAVVLSAPTNSNNRTEQNQEVGNKLEGSRSGCSSQQQENLSENSQAGGNDRSFGSSQFSNDEQREGSGSFSNNRQAQSSDQYGNNERFQSGYRQNQEYGQYDNERNQGYDQAGNNRRFQSGYQQNQRRNQFGYQQNQGYDQSGNEQNKGNSQSHGSEQFSGEKHGFKEQTGMPFTGAPGFFKEVTGIKGVFGRPNFGNNRHPGRLPAAAATAAPVATVTLSG